MNRRTFIQSSAVAGTFASPSVFAKPASGKAEHCVMLWLGGGMSQIDTFDPKPLGDAKTKKAGAEYPAWRGRFAGGNSGPRKQRANKGLYDLRYRRLSRPQVACG